MNGRECSNIDNNIHIFPRVPTNIMSVEFEIKTFTDMHVHGDDIHTYMIYSTMIW